MAFSEIVYPMGRDELFANKGENLKPFRFDDDVATVFSDMIRRSVPGYGSVVSGTLSIAEHFLRPDTRCFDLGSSLGAVSLSISSHLSIPGCEIIAVDNSQAMVKKLQETSQSNVLNIPLTVLCADIGDIRVENASMVVLNYTLQFFEPKRRLNLLEKIYQGLNPGGVLVLSEKVVSEASLSTETSLHLGHDMMDSLHQGFKRVNGYSELEISQKRSALEQVLIPEAESAHVERLHRAGFLQVEKWFQAFNFISLLAIK